MLRKLFRSIRKKLIGNVNKWPLERKIKGCMALFKKRMGYDFDINNPKTFNEKLQWYKLFYDSEAFPAAVDKYLFKAYVDEKLGKGYTIPLYGAWENVEDFRKDWDKLPEDFCLKATLMSDGKNIKMIHNKSSIDVNQLCCEVSEWLKPQKTLINSYCKAYHRAVPRVIAEAYEAQIDGQLYDYKVFCFNGKPYCFYVATDHFPGQLSHISFYDFDWKRMDVRYGEHPNCDVEKPKHFEQMLEISKKLSEEFPFVRVDFFEVGEKLYVAELTFYPGGGLTPYHPESFSKELGDLFILPERNVKE